MKKSSLVVQSNQIIEARYRLTRDEQRLLRIIISAIGKDDDDFGEYELSINELVDVMGINKDSAYQKIKALTRKLINRSVEIKNDSKKRYIQFSWLSMAEYQDGNGVVVFSIHPKLKPFFLELKKHFTKYDLKNIMLLNSTYAIRFYELGKKNIGLQSRENYIDLENLREWLELRKNQYVAINNFTYRVLEPAKKEINKHTDITFDYEPVKRGRGGKVVGYTLRFNQAKTANQAPSPIPESVADVIKQLQVIGIKDVRPDTAQAWLDKYGKEKVRVAVEVAQENQARGKQVGAGLIVSALKKDWSSEAYQGRKEKQKIQDKDKTVLAREASKMRVDGFYKQYSRKTTSLVKKWHDGLPESEQELIKDQYQRQNPLFARKEKQATSPTVYYRAHLLQLYKSKNALQGFSTWLEEYTKKKNVKLTKQDWFAVAELERH